MRRTQVMPFASFIYGFLPAMITQSMLPFKRVSATSGFVMQLMRVVQYYTFVVAAKPTKK
jgi:hypothetical protein